MGLSESVSTRVLKFCTWDSEFLGVGIGGTVNGDKIFTIWRWINFFATVCSRGKISKNLIAKNFGQKFIKNIRHTVTYSHIPNCTVTYPILNQFHLLLWIFCKILWFLIMLIWLISLQTQCFTLILYYRTYWIWDAYIILLMKYIGGVTLIKLETYIL